MKRKAFVVGGAGRDRRLLSAQLPRRGCEVPGYISSPPKCGGSEFAPIGITSQVEVSDFVRTFLPDEIYFLAAFH